ncbi:potassium channel family protein [Mumia flava]|uniref:potassium channel family protein n=1 Tax=Mumia flava TaxID=1348852 RepID=UPI0012FE493A|nr:potassium channel family protein [Mumia flava]
MNDEKRDRFGLLLLLLLGVMILSPIDVAALRPLVSASLGVLLVFAQWISGARRRELLVSASFVVFAVVIGSSAQLADAQPAAMAYAGVNVLLCIATIVMIVLRILEQPRVSAQTVAGGLCIYLLVALAYTFGYVFLAALNDGFFAETTGLEGENLITYLYFSLTTISTTGYGDLTAADDSGRMLAVSEAVIGQLYLVTIVALLVGNLGRVRAPRPRHPRRGRGR